MPWGRERGAGVSPPRGHPRQSPEPPAPLPGEPTRARCRARCPKPPWHRAPPLLLRVPAPAPAGCWRHCPRWGEGDGALRAPILQSWTHNGAGGPRGDPQPPPGGRRNGGGGFSPAFGGPNPWQHGQQADGGGSVTACPTRPSQHPGGAHVPRKGSRGCSHHRPPSVLPSPLPPPRAGGAEPSRPSVGDEVTLREAMQA